MVAKLVIGATPSTPAIYLDPATGYCRIVGRAMPIDAGAVFNPILDWVAAYWEQPAQETHFTFDLDYFNSTASLLLARLFSALGGLPGLHIHWMYHPDDEDIMEAGEEFSRLMGHSFSMEPKEG